MPVRNITFPLRMPSLIPVFPDPHQLRRIAGGFFAVPLLLLGYKI